MDKYTRHEYIYIEPHENWVKPGMLFLDPIVERIYGKPFESLRSCQQGRDNVPNDTEVMYFLENYEQSLNDSQEKDFYLGWDSIKKEGVFKTGMTPIEYWKSISWVGLNGHTESNVEHNPPKHMDLENKVFPREDYAQRAYSPPLDQVLADLMSRGEIPFSNYLFKNWW